MLFHSGRFYWKRRVYLLERFLQKESKKYKGRESVKKSEVPGLGKWNDVIHFSPINPNDIIKELKRAGAPGFSWKAFVIDADSLDWSKTKIMTTSRVNGREKHQFLPCTADNLHKNNKITELTKEHYRESVAEGEQPFILAGSPHVLYKGHVDTAGLKVVQG